MIIGIDISSLPYGTGVSNYTYNLVRHLLKIDKTNHYKLFFSSFRQPLPHSLKKLSVHKNLSIHHFRLPPSLLEILWNRLHILPIEKFIGNCDIFHTWDWTEPPTKKAVKVTTIHDFVPFLYPDTQHPKTIAVFKRKLFWAARECRHFICVSQNSKKDFQRLFPGIPANKVTVIPEAAEDKYSQFHRLPEAEKTKKISIINRQYGLHNFILAQGTREPRKNLDRLVKAFIQYKAKHPRSDVELAISGKYGWGKDLPPPADNCVKVLGYIPEKDLVALHASALCLAYPSLYEGFGLPVLKSMAVGTPVITSNLSSIPEVTGKAALLVNPLSIPQIENAITRITARPELRRRLIRQGLAQARKFSWTKTAKQTKELYEKIFKE